MFDIHNYLNTILLYLYLDINVASLYSISLNFSFQKKIDNPFFVCPYVATACCFVRKRLFFDATIRTSLKLCNNWTWHNHHKPSSVPLLLNFKFEFVWFRVKTSISLATQTNRLCATEFSFEQTSFSSIMLLMLTAASTTKTLCCWIGWNFIRTVSTPQSSIFFADLLQLYKSCSRNDR